MIVVRWMGISTESLGLTLNQIKLVLRCNNQLRGNLLYFYLEFYLEILDLIPQPFNLSRAVTSGEWWQQLGRAKLGNPVTPIRADCTRVPHRLQTRFEPHSDLSFLKTRRYCAV